MCHLYRVAWDEVNGSDKVWYLDTQRRLQYYEERKRTPTVVTIGLRKSFSWPATPVTGHPFIWQVDTTLEPWRGPAAKTRRSTQALDQYGNVTTAEEYDYGLDVAARKIYSMVYLSSSAYTSLYIRNRLTHANLNAGGVNTALAVNTYDAPCFQIPSGASFTVDATKVVLHDSEYQNAQYRGNLTSFSTIGNGGCQWFDYLGWYAPNRITQVRCWFLPIRRRVMLCRKYYGQWLRLDAAVGQHAAFDAGVGAEQRDVGVRL